jgi:hypothetical protein
MVFACFWDKSFAPIMDSGVLKVIADNITTVVTLGIESGSLLNFTRRFESTGNVMGLAATEQAIKSTVLVAPASSDEGQPPVQGSESGTGEYDEPVDVHSWNALRYASLGVFVGTIVLTALCMSLAAYRKHRLMKKSVWGNLKLDEAGVNELLKTGWKLQDQKTLQVYDKHRLGYYDDDSVLIGGYEQKEGCAIGGEIITVTQSETTPNTALSEQKDRVRF